MIDLYMKNDANFPRLNTDTFFINFDNEYEYSGIVDSSAKFIQDFQLVNDDQWALFVKQFVDQPDGADNGWRGEYWGKMMRGACFVYSYTKSKKLYDALKKTVQDILKVQESDGRVSSYSKEKEFNGWDMWSRKYVLLGLEYFLEICPENDLCNKIIDSMCRQLDYIIDKIGTKEKWEQNQLNPYLCWKGLNTSSVLEPVVRLYNITKKQKYFDFADTIVNCSSATAAIFKIAAENKLYPYQYPFTKAYEMISCFEGLLEFYRVTKKTEYKTTLINFADKILESDFTIIGSCGCTHELFDHSSVRQANTTNYWVMQETCVTVTLMKFMMQMTLLTGDIKYSDAFEVSYYNAYLGSINTDKVIGSKFSQVYPTSKPKVVPFDSYSPLTSGIRGNAVGGHRIITPDGDFYGCCMCIGSAGVGMMPKMSVLTAKDGVVMNMFVPGRVTTFLPDGQKLVLLTKTEYPYDNKVTTVLNLDSSKEFSLYIRNPKWSKSTAVYVNGKSVDICDGYVKIKRTWSCGDVIELVFNMEVVPVYPVEYDEQILNTKVIYSPFELLPVTDTQDPLAKNHISFLRGPVVLAQDQRFGYSVDEPVKVQVEADGTVNATIANSTAFNNNLCLEMTIEDGKKMLLCDYSSAGKTWSDDSKMAAWILTK